MKKEMTILLSTLIIIGITGLTIAEIDYSEYADIPFDDEEDEETLPEEDEETFEEETTNEETNFDTTEYADIPFDEEGGEETFEEEIETNTKKPATNNKQNEINLQKTKNFYLAVWIGSGGAILIILFLFLLFKKPKDPFTKQNNKKIMPGITPPKTPIPQKRAHPAGKVMPPRKY